ncbi:MAG TPA: LysE family transporter [Candidatus Limnocylindrales bacterium]
MNPGTFGRGLLFGFTIAAAVGPIALLCIRRTLAGGRLVGLASGLGVATADAFYGGIAAFGVTAISEVLIGERRLLALAGGAALVVLGVRTLRSRPATVPVAADGRGLLAAYTSILGLTLTNPMTILSFAGLVAGLGLVGEGGSGATVLVSGVFAGSALWWVLLVSAVSLLRARIPLDALRWLNVGSGLVIGVFGLVAIASGLLG